MLIIDGLIDMEYVDKEICDLIYNKVMNPLYHVDL
jgi:hypothetical protein